MLQILKISYVRYFQGQCLPHLIGLYFRLQSLTWTVNFLRMGRESKLRKGSNNIFTDKC